jgi:hypothetical protein
VLLCRRLDPYVGEVLAVDGTCIKAVNNKDRKFTHSGSTRGDVEDGATGGGARTKNLA